MKPPPLSRLIINRTPALLLAGATFSGTLFIALDSLAAAAAAIIVSSAILFLFRKEPLSFPLYTIVFIAFAMWTAILRPVQPGNIKDELHGTIEEIRETPNSLRAYVNTAEAGRVAVIVTDITPEISEGDIVSFQGMVSSPHRRSAVPFFTSERLNSRASRISASVVVSPQDITVIGHDSSLRYRFLQHRRALADIIHSSPLSPEAAGVLSTAIFATDDVQPDIRNNFRITGLSHLLCVSGFHVGIVAALVLFVLSPLRLTGRRVTLRFAIAVVLIWIYALITGLSAPVTRAAVMLTLFALARITQRRANPFNTLLLAFCAVLALDPWQLFSAGFQLSFAAVAGILLLARKLNPFAERQRLWFKIAAVFTVPIAAMLATAPLMLLWFQRLPLLSVPVNAIGTLIFPLFIIVSGIGVILWHAGLPSALLFYISDRLFAILEGVVNGTNALSERYSLVMMPSTTELIIITILVGLLMYGIHISRHRRHVLVTGICLVGVLISCRLKTPSASIYIDGDTRGTDVVVARRGAVDVFTSTQREYPLMNTAPIMAAYGSDTLRVTSGVETMEALGRPIVFLSERVRCPENAIVIVTKHSAEKAAQAVASRKPAHVLIGADISHDSRLRIIRTCRRHSLPYTDLREQAFFCN